MDVSIDVSMDEDVIMDVSVSTFCHVFALELMRITLVRSDKSQELTECLLQSQFLPDSPVN